MPNAAMKAKPVRRSVIVLLPQPWSTATIQTKNNKIAMIPRIFSSMIVNSRSQTRRGITAEKLA
jgi:hypothetical protein